MVAMAQSVIVMVQLLAAFGFDVALIRDRAATDEHYHTAWTLNVALGALISVIVLALAVPIAHFYGKPELVWVVCLLSLTSLFAGLENIGVVAFRKELRFRSEFVYQIGRKLVAIAVTLPLAWLLRSYWALVAGTLASAVATMVASYYAHPFRPRPTLAKARELLEFSRWLLVGNAVAFVRERSSDFFIGRLSGPAALGTYSISYEISNLPTTELSAPINRALMGKYIAEQTVKQMIQAGFSIKGAHIIVLGLTFKENCPDLRNSKVIDVIRELESYGATVHVHDPVAESAEAEHEYGVKLVPWEHLPKANAIVAAVAHKEFGEHSLDQMLGKLSNGGVFVDVKCTADMAIARSP